jgi:dTDP-4-dehydrorhamnose 3,5-epimerase
MEQHTMAAQGTMKLDVISTKIEGLLIIDTDFFRDHRGFFIESYQEARYREAGITYSFVQDNHSRSRKHVLRGFHYQDTTAPMGKLVRCVTGAILDVLVDLRLGSPTFGEWVAVELNEDNMRQVMVPPWCGHAFLTLSDTADVSYKCTTYYNRASEGTVAWNDPDIGVAWPVADPIISERDSMGMSLQDYAANPAYRAVG